VAEWDRQTGVRVPSSSAVECFLFLMYLTTPSVPRTVQRRTVGSLVNNELERMWKEAVVARFVILMMQGDHVSLTLKIWAVDWWQLLKKAAVDFLETLVTLYHCARRFPQDSNFRCTCCHHRDELKHLILCCCSEPRQRGRTACQFVLHSPRDLMRSKFT
jgi:hypothetical protein